MKNMTTIMPPNNHGFPSMSSAIFNAPGAFCNFEYCTHVCLHCPFCLLVYKEVQHDVLYFVMQKYEKREDIIFVTNLDVAINGAVHGLLATDGSTESGTSNDVRDRHGNDTKAQCD